MPSDEDRAEARADGNAAACNNALRDAAKGLHCLTTSTSGMDEVFELLRGANGANVTFVVKVQDTETKPFAVSVVSVGQAER